MPVKTDMEEKKLLNKVIIFILIAYKKYSCSYIILRLNHWCHMDYFNDVLTTFLGLERGTFNVLSMEGQKALGFHQKYLNLWSEDDRGSYWFGTTWGSINDSDFIFGWTIPLNQCSTNGQYNAHKYVIQLLIAVTGTSWQSKHNWCW